MWKLLLSLWMGIKFALIAIILFIAGLVEGIVLPNVNIFFQVLVPILTTAGAILLLLGWLRWRVPPARALQRNAAHSPMADFFFR